MKVLVIGIDGATWDVLDDYLLRNYMPNLYKIKTKGYFGVLRSTDPPITPAAWTSCITGCQPYTHGVLGFKDYSFNNDCLSISSASSCCVPTMWQELSKQGYRIASINVPWTYPCSRANGFIVAGYGVPGIKVPFTYPEHFKTELLQQIPDYDVLAKWEKFNDIGSEKFDANISRVERCFQQRLETARIICSKQEFDIMMVQFQDIDMIQHHMWPCVDRNTRNNYPFVRDRLFHMFEKLDESIGSLLDLAESNGLVVIVVSDHGFGRMLGSIKPNMLLHKWNYLNYKSPIRRMYRRIQRNLCSLSKKRTPMPIELKSPVDWKNTKAMVLYAAMNGHVYLNVKGRNLNGCVMPGREYNEIIKDLKRKFLQVTHPETGDPIFSKVSTPSEFYTIENVNEERLGDLILVPRQGYIVHQSTTRKGNYIDLQPDDSLSGCHYSDGIFIFFGYNIKNDQNKRAHIVDIAPTIYAVMGARIPTYLDGKVLKDVFVENLKIQYETPKKSEFSKKSDRYGLSEKEQKLVAKRLSDLGYLD